MSRIIQLNGSGKQRELLVRSIVLALRELAARNEVSDETRDLAAYISLALHSISQSIDPTVEAWEKRGYWLKADRFRLEWAWTGEVAIEMRAAALKGDWERAAGLCAKIAQRLDGVTLPKRNRLGTPWVGAWERLSSLS